MDDAKCPTRIPGFSHNGDCNLICKPSDWKDILIFFLGNYGAHAATVIGRPGQSSLTWAFSLILALFFPGAGVLTGVTAIASLALFAPTELATAARAGALCVVVKADGRDAKTDVEIAQPQPSTLKSEASDRSSQGDSRPTEGYDEAVHVVSPRPVTGQVLDNQEAANISTGGIQETAHDVERKSVELLQERASQANDTAIRSHSTQVTQPSDKNSRETLDGRPDEVLPSSLMASQVHGIARLPAGYRLLVLPGWTTFEQDHDGDEKETSSTEPATFTAQIQGFLGSPFKPQLKLTSTVPCSYNAVKALISIGQLLYSVLTLYETRGNQLAVYGYAAFGLTVAPYFWMSLVNLLGNLMCPQYPNIFIVNSPTLDQLRREIEVKRLAGRYPFDGTVGRISEETETRVLEANGHLLKRTTALEIFFSRLDTEESPEAWKLACQAIAAYVVAAVPIAIVGGISRFDPGHSAAYQRVWTMMWLCFGPMVGIGYGMWILPLFESWPVLWRSLMIRKASELSEEARVSGHLGNFKVAGHHDGNDTGGANQRRTDDAPRFVIWAQIGRFALAAIFIAAYTAPAIGGFVVVGQMLMQYGTCSKLN